jgi:hypothetical protein
MQCQNPYKISDINVEKIFYKNIKESNNKKIIFIKYKENFLKNMVFQLPTINNKFNLYNNEIDIIVESNDEDKTLKIIDFFNLIDSKIVNDAKTHANLWFDHIEDKSKINYHHILRNKKETNFSLKLKIIDSKDFKTNLILNNDDEYKLDLDNLPNEGNVKLVLECYAIWIHDNNFGLILRPIIISFIMNIENDYNYKILDDSDSEESSDDLFIKDTDSEKSNDKLFIKDSDSEESNDKLFIKASEINNEKVKLNLNETLTNTPTSDSDENNLNKLIFNFKN